MNKKIVMPGICLAGAALIAGGVLKKSADASTTQTEYLREVEKYNSLPSTERGQLSTAYMRAAQLKAQLDPEKTEKINKLKILMARSKNDDDKISYLRQCVQIDPTDDLCLSLLATYLDKKGDLEGAKNCYSKIIEVSKFNARIKMAKRELEKLENKK